MSRLYAQDGTAHQDMRENFILINAFYTNSILLTGLIDFLSEHFNFYFIDLPGFAKHSPPLERISLEGFARYVAGKIDEFDLDHYVIGGISFGFTVANCLPCDERCKGIVGIFPYLDAQSLNLERRKKVFYSRMVSFIVFSGLSGKIWKSRTFQKIAFWYSSYPPERIRIILDHMDGRTFFETAKIILCSNDGISLQDRPYVLIVNKKDSTIRSDYSLQIFLEKAKNLYVAYTDVDHYPEDLTREFFEEKFPKEEMEEIVFFINHPDRCQLRTSDLRDKKTSLQGN